MPDFIGSLFHSIVSFFSNWSKTALSIDYRLPTIITMVVMALKFFVNQHVCALDFKKAAIELPCEIITLSLGFIIIRINNTKETLFRAFAILFILIFVTALVKHLQAERVISKIKFFSQEFFFCLLCYLLSIISYYLSMGVAIG